MTMPWDRRPEDDEPNPDEPACMAAGGEACAGFEAMVSRHRERERDLLATIQRQAADLAAAEKWARDYQTKHGAFERDPPEPDFMIVF